MVKKIKIPTKSKCSKHKGAVNASGKEKKAFKAENNEVNFEPEMDENLLMDLEYILDGESTEDVESIIEEFLEHEDILNEALSIMGRKKKAMTMRRFRSRLKISRKRAMKRKATQSIIKRRSRKGAILSLKKKFSSNKGSKKKASYTERARLERILKSRKSLVNRGARRGIVKARKTERTRLSGKR